MFRILATYISRRGIIDEDLTSRDWILKREALIRERQKRRLEERRGEGEGKVSINKIPA